MLTIGCESPTACSNTVASLYDARHFGAPCPPSAASSDFACLDCAEPVVRRCQPDEHGCDDGGGGEQRAETKRRQDAEKRNCGEHRNDPASPVRAPQHEDRENDLCCNQDQ